jgi:hypothetical protein
LNDDIPDEQGITYSPMKYIMDTRGGLELYGNKPSAFVRVEKSQNYEGWLLVLTNTHPQEFKVMFTY